MRKSNIEREIIKELKEVGGWQSYMFERQGEAGWLWKVNEEFKELQAELKKRQRDINAVYEEAADYLFVLQGLKKYSKSFAEHLESLFFLAYSKLIFNEDFLKVMKEKMERNRKGRTFRFVYLEADGYYKGDHYE